MSKTAGYGILRASRRQFISRAGKLAGAVALTFPAPFVGLARAQEVLKLGVVIPKTGVFTEQGETLARGVKIALDAAGNKIANKSVEMIWYDDAGPQVAQQNFQKLVEEEKVFAVIGGASSASALAMSSVASRLKMPFINPNGAAREITGKDCNRYTFRVQATAPVASRAMAPFLTAIGKKWYFLMPAYAFGQDAYASMKELLREAGGTELGADHVPLGTSDFSSFILKIRQVRPDVIVTALVGSDLSSFLKQLVEFGVAGKIPVANPLISDTDLWPLGKAVPKGYWGKLWHFSDPENSEETKQLASAYQSQFGKPAATATFLAWTSARMLLAAANEVQSTKPADIVKGLETVKVKENDTSVYFREWDHQLIRPTLILGTRTVISDPLDPVEIVSRIPSSAAGMEDLFGNKGSIGCSMGEL